MTATRWRITRALDRRLWRGVELGSHDITVQRDLRTPMEDGVELLGDLYLPVDVDGRMPTIVIRGPYGRRGGIGTIARVLAYSGFPVLFQSCRGTWGSGGEFRPWVDEQRDSIATYRWVRRQPWFTGRLATTGESYMAYAEWAAAGTLQREHPEDAPEALVVEVALTDFGSVAWENGAFALNTALGWSRGMDRLRQGRTAMLGMLLPDRSLKQALDVLPLGAGDTAAAGHPIEWYQEWLRHEDLADEYWTRQSHTASVADVTAPVFMTTGWYDLFLPSHLRSYRRLVEAGKPPRLTIGAWSHRSPERASEAHPDTVAFLRETFLGDAWDRPAPVHAYQTGAERWHDLPEWPPPTASRVWRLGGDRRMSPDAAAPGISSYTYDPQHPTPAVGGPMRQRGAEPVDNAEHEQRPDVATYRSDPISAPLDVAGEPVASVRVRSSAPSFDVFVRITDVHPDGRSMTVCDGIRRIGSAATVATDPGPDGDGFREVAVTLWPTFHRFAAGHRLGVQISSGAHPRFARNPGTGEAAVDAAETVVAHQELAHGGSTGTRIALPVWSP